MARSYAKHGLVALSLRAKRRRHGNADMRTLEGRMAEQVRLGVVSDKGGADQCSTAMLVAIELLKGEVSTLAAIDKGIKSYLRKHPEARTNPRGVAKLHSYRSPQVQAILKILAIVGLDKLDGRVPRLADVLAEPTDEVAQDAQDEPGGAHATPDGSTLGPVPESVANSQPLSQGKIDGASKKVDV